jgi:hypothetical protein
LEWFHVIPEPDFLKGGDILKPSSTQGQAALARFDPPASSANGREMRFPEAIHPTKQNLDHGPRQRQVSEEQNMLRFLCMHRTC